jgi:hypothetical protein
MTIEIRLKKILQEYNFDTQKGIEKKIADDLGVHRHSIGKLYRNQSKNPSLDILDKICNWLIERGVPRHILPQQLFGMQAMKLWEAMAASGDVTFYLGEYQQEIDAPTYGQRWISSRDAETAGRIEERIGLIIPESEEKRKKPSPQFHTTYVTFHSISKGKRKKIDNFEVDVTYSRDIFEKMRSQLSRHTSILIGSQRVNYLLEHFVADMFGRQPFQSTEISRIPFYIKYRPSDLAATSCFGDKQDHETFKYPGIYYLTSENKWIGLPWKWRELDTGVVIILRDPGNESLEIAVFGFSGRATMVIGQKLYENAVNFWPPTARSKDKEVGIYICRLEYSPTTDPDPMKLEAKTFEVIPIDKKILEDRLA